MPAQYREMAAFYDWPGAVDFSRFMYGLTRRAFRARRIAPDARVCDLACGTGNLAMRLARAGYTVQGVDLSPAMVRRARKKLREARLPADFAVADMRTFALRARVDAVTCYYDSINHLLTTRDVHRALRRVHAALRPGGLFCFDANTLYCFQEFWAGLTHKIEHNGVVQIIEGRFSERSGRASGTVTGFVPVGRNRYRKFAERVDERYYPRDAWRDMLQATGFANVHIQEFDPWRHGGPKRIKWFITAARPLRG